MRGGWRTMHLPTRLLKGKRAAPADYGEISKEMSEVMMKTMERTAKERKAYMLWTLKTVIIWVSAALALELVVWFVAFRAMNQ